MLEKRETLAGVSKSSDHDGSLSDEGRWSDEAEADGDPPRPEVGRWGDEWPSWLGDSDRDSGVHHLTPILPRPRWAPPTQPIHLTRERHEDLVAQSEAILR